VPVGSSKTFHIKLVLQREPRTGKTWFLAGLILPNALVDAAVRELFEKSGQTLTADDLTLLGGNPVRVPLHVGEHKLVHVFSASIHVPYVNTDLHTQSKVEHAVTAQ
jgi:ADP-ribose pyrophosphatase YjhB (NUDIX family)